MDAGEVIGHETMSQVVEAVAGTGLSIGDRVVVPFPISCGSCWMCVRGLRTQCETTQVHAHGSGAALFGYSRLYGSVAGGQTQHMLIPHADFGPIPVGQGLPDHRYLFHSDILPTAWQGVAYAGVGEDDARVFGIDPVPERRLMAARHGIEVFDADDTTTERIREETQGRGPDAVVDAVGMEAHGSPGAGLAQKIAGALPDPLARKEFESTGVDDLVTHRRAYRERGGPVVATGSHPEEDDHDGRTHDGAHRTDGRSARRPRNAHT